MLRLGEQVFPIEEHTIGYPVPNGQLIYIHISSIIQVEQFVPMYLGIFIYKHT